MAPTRGNWTHRGPLALVLALIACGPGGIGPGEDPVRVLFLGNSLTYYNDLPGMLRQMAAAHGIALEILDASQGGYALEDHWADAASRAALDEGGWDVVVLQQGPSSLPENRDNLVMWSGVWADAIRDRGGIPALYMVWPDRSRLRFFDDVILSYRTAAADADARLYRAGETWLAAWDEDPNLPLYGPDDFHPSVMGTYLAALTIYRGLTGREPPSLSGLGISGVEDAILHDAARQVAQ